MSLQEFLARAVGAPEYMILRSKLRERLEKYEKTGDTQLVLGDTTRELAERIVSELNKSPNGMVEQSTITLLMMYFGTRAYAQPVDARAADKAIEVALARVAYDLGPWSRLFVLADHTRAIEDGRRGQRLTGAQNNVNLADSLEELSRVMPQFDVLTEIVDLYEAALSSGDLSPRESERVRARLATLDSQDDKLDLEDI